MKLFISFKNFEKNAVSGPAVAQRWPTGYILPAIANGGPLASCYLGILELIRCRTILGSFFLKGETRDLKDLFSCFFLNIQVLVSILHL